jgi:hypothetical protein
MDLVRNKAKDITFSHIDKKMNLRFQPAMSYWPYESKKTNKHKLSKMTEKGEGHKTLHVASGE